MPAMTSIAEFNRKSGEMVKRLQKSQEPLYLTRNGKSCLVVMDAEAFDRTMRRREVAREREMRVYDGILQGIDDMQNGRVTDYKDGLSSIRAQKGW